VNQLQVDSVVVRKGNKESKEVPMTLFLFDPNVADSAELSDLGLSPFVVRNILNYREKGGRFPTPESMERIYGLSEDKYKELEPYIQISESFLPKKKEKTLVKEYKKSEKKDTMVSVQRIVKYPEGTLVDINRADTIELQKIPGIGSGISKLIVAYRNRLGGFYALEQLLEVKFVTSDMLKWFKLEDEIQRKMDINKVGLEELRAHPYLNFYQAKVIVEHRRKKGPIKSLSQLALYEEFTEKDLERLSAYISFD
jgi:competence ComEA-like helix-hairpin-helix protein